MDDLHRLHASLRHDVCSRGRERRGREKKKRNAHGTAYPGVLAHFDAANSANWADFLGHAPRKKRGRKFGGKRKEKERRKGREGEKRESFVCSAVRAESSECHKLNG